MHRKTVALTKRIRPLVQCTGPQSQQPQRRAWSPNLHRLRRPLRLRGARRRGHLRVRLSISIIRTQRITTQSEKQRATHQRPADCSVANHAHSALDPPHVVQTAVRSNGFTFDMDGWEGMSGAPRRDRGLGVAGYADSHGYNSTCFLDAVFDESF